MTEVKIYKSVYKNLKLVVLGLTFVVMGIILIQPNFNNNSYIIGWVCIGFFGLCTIVGLYQVFDKKPRLILTPKYLIDYTNKLGKIEWSQIREAHIHQIFSQKFMNLTTTSDYVVPKKESKWAKKFTKALEVSPAQLNIAALNIDENELEDFINKLINLKEDQRVQQLRVFQKKLHTKAAFPFKKIVIYLIVSALLLLLSLQSINLFIGIMCATGVGALLARWYGNSKNQPVFVKFAERAVYFGVINLVLLLIVTKFF